MSDIPKLKPDRLIFDGSPALSVEYKVFQTGIHGNTSVDNVVYPPRYVPILLGFTNTSVEYKFLPIDEPI